MNIAATPPLPPAAVPSQPAPVKSASRDGDGDNDGSAASSPSVSAAPPAGQGVAVDTKA